MRAPYDVGFLRPDEVSRTFAIMQIVMPSMNLAAWQRLVTQDPEGRGWAVARDERGYIRGVCRMHPATDPSTGRLLEVPMLVAFSLWDEAGVSGDLLDFARHHAWEEGCQAIRLWNRPVLSPEDLESPQPRGALSQSFFYDLATDDNHCRH